jgi:hypothetical protein
MPPVMVSFSGMMSNASSPKPAIWRSVRVMSLKKVTPGLRALGLIDVALAKGLFGTKPCSIEPS